MATVLVVEPNAEVRELLVRVVRRLGHEALVGEREVTAPSQDVDLVLLEPADERSLEALEPMLGSGSVRLVCVSILPPSERVLALAPAAYVQKPFLLAQLERALSSALERAPAVAAGCQFV